MATRECHDNVLVIVLLTLIAAGAAVAGVATISEGTPKRLGPMAKIKTATVVATSTTTTTTPTPIPISNPTNTTTTTTTTTTSVLMPLEPSRSSTDNGNVTVPAVPDVCVNGIKLTINTDEGQSERYEADFVQIIDGDAILSVMTNDPTSALLVINRLNEANFLEADFEIGIRAIFVETRSEAESLLLQEVTFLQQCVTHGIGIFIDHELYHAMEDIIKELEYNIWPIGSPRAWLFPKVAHLLHQMPWGDKIASVEILTESVDVYNEFMDAVRREHMCLMHFKSEDNVYILFGNKMATHFNENGTIFAVPTQRTDRSFIEEMPSKAYILMENEVDLRPIDQNTTYVTLNRVLVGKTILSSRVLVLARPVLNLLRWLKASLMKHCKQDNSLFIFETCFNFLKFVSDWTTIQYSQSLSAAEILDLLHMRRLANNMNFQMYQKMSAPGEKKMLAAAATAMATTTTTAMAMADLREIASQNFITNITTFYHYNYENTTSLELKAKFGQVFNCQYVAGDNQRYPFLFDGESVMFWRIKSAAWVATGMTAAILGIIITLAILVFIVVRISLGDVFEGNPVTSILLLISMVVLFVSFVPFAMEYVGEHRNSHVTFEDAATLNTLCAVRVFILTLVYSFTFSLLLCRAVMLASIGSEGGFLSHVNGYIQAVICFFSVLVQLGMSIQMLVVFHVASASISCENIYYGHWLWALMAYDFVLLLGVVGLVPFIYRSQRNYREGILIVIGVVLIFIIWIAWITLAFFGDEMRDAAIPLGQQATGWAILFGILIPRTFLIVRGIERSDIAQALPSLTSLAFAQNNQYSSEQSVYECVNPAMRNCSQEDVAHQSPSEIPTLPLRGGGPRRQQFFANLRQANANINPPRAPACPRRSSLTHSSPSPTGSVENNKMTRF